MIDKIPRFSSVFMNQAKRGRACNIINFQRSAQGLYKSRFTCSHLSVEGEYSFAGKGIQQSAGSIVKRIRGWDLNTEHRQFFILDLG